MRLTIRKYPSSIKRPQLSSVRSARGRRTRWYLARPEVELTYGFTPTNSEPSSSPSTGFGYGDQDILSHNGAHPLPRGVYPQGKGYTPTHLNHSGQEQITTTEKQQQPCHRNCGL